MATKLHGKNKTKNNKLRFSTIALNTPPQARIRMPETIKDFRTLSRGKCGATIYIYKGQEWQHTLA